MSNFVPNSNALQVQWRKSTRSGGNGNCVEIATVGTTTSYVRDSKDPEGPALVFPADTLAAFVASAAAGEFDLGVV
ncbi:DUF397 domain-containing protein [Kitasatospora indigofera]|uniref:DUF397 domain-containing protein n=1 Tax=Kitasatospora indigofera TaxID=67307 RepID=UPI00367BD0FC